MIALGEVAVIGGGCYGGFYLEQLARARAASAVTWRALRVVDRDARCAAADAVPAVPDTTLAVRSWDAFLDDWLVASARRDDDRIVPSPLMPHLMADWLRRRAGERWPEALVALVPADAEAGTPFDRLHPGDGVRYLSHADWTCPVHCIEPHTCPAIRAPRSWEMSDTVARWTETHAHREPTVGPVLFACRHVSHGVGMFPVTQAFAALDDLDAAVRRHGRADLVIGSVSACHGALAVLRVAA